jgi:hypothetical protein
MLECEEGQARYLGYDRPSKMLLGFLAKHFGLKNYTRQTNNFVVYKEYFASRNSPVTLYGKGKELKSDIKLSLWPLARTLPLNQSNNLSEKLELPYLSPHKAMRLNNSKLEKLGSNYETIETP